MLNRMFFAAAPMMLALCVTSVASAEESLLEKLAAQNAVASQAAEVAMTDDEMGVADVDALLSDGTESGDEAIAASCRSFRGYGSFGSYNSYRGFSSFSNYGYSSYSPRTYSSRCYRPVYYYTPVSYSYSYSVPAYRTYWGCW